MGEEAAAQGVAIHAITAETGGDEEIKNRLTARDTVVSYPVHGDPEHHLLVRRKQASGAAAKPGLIAAEDIQEDPNAKNISEEEKAKISEEFQTLMRDSMEEFFGEKYQEKPDLRSTTEEEKNAS